ncbi:MAG: TIGR02186 family protein [Alphaproteobacteria bacterium]
MAWPRPGGAAPALRRAIRALSVAGALCLPLAASGQAPIVADLSSHVVAIDTGFVGAEVVLFGATEGGSDIIVVIRGPARSVTVRERVRVLGIWVNATGLQFMEAPSYYAIASTRPLDEVLPPDARALYQIGIEMVAIAPAPGSAEDFDPAVTAVHRGALIAQMRGQGLYRESAAGVSVLGGRLFRTDVSFPSDVPTGAYFVEVYEIRDAQVVGAQTTPLIVRKVGLEASLYRFAHEYSVYYGAAAVLVAFAAGFLPTMVRWLR